MTKSWYPWYIKIFVLQTCKKKRWTSTETSNKGKKNSALVPVIECISPKDTFAFQISNSLQEPETNTQWAWGESILGLLVEKV